MFFIVDDLPVIMNWNRVVKILFKIIANFPLERRVAVDGFGSNQLRTQIGLLFQKVQISPSSKEGAWQRLQQPSS
jgi:hypothetical protein